MNDKSELFARMPTQQYGIHSLLENFTNRKMVQQQAATVRRFAENSTLHGLRHITEAKTRVPQLVWLTIFILASVVLICQLSLLIARYQQYPKQTKTDIASEAVTFPSITICNSRNLDLPLLEKLGELLLGGKDTARDACLKLANSNDSFLSEYGRLCAITLTQLQRYPREHRQMFVSSITRSVYYDNIPHDVLAKGGVKLKTFLLYCTYLQQPCDYEHDFEHFVDTFYYNCYTFDGRVIGTRYGQGIENGCNAVVFTGSGGLPVYNTLEAVPAIFDPDSPLDGSDSARIVIHPPGTRPFPNSDGFDVPPGYSATLGITPKQVNRLGQPYGQCLNAHEKDSVKRRVDCEKACLQKFIVASCGCTDSFLPVPDNTTAPACRRLPTMPEACLYEYRVECFDYFLQLHKRVECIRAAKHNFSTNASAQSECYCHPSCAEVVYSLTYSLKHWPSATNDGAYAISNYIRYFQAQPEYKLWLQRYENNTNKPGWWHKLGHDNFAMLNIYFESTYTLVTSEVPHYTSLMLLSEIGGQLGLWIGMSIISLTEFVDLIFSLCRLALRSEHLAASH